MTKPEVVCCRARGEQLEGDIGPDHVKIRNIHNHYLQDREEQKGETFTGMGKHFLIHDSCATESMGTIVDRSKERLGDERYRRNCHQKISAPMRQGLRQRARAPAHYSDTGTK